MVRGKDFTHMGDKLRFWAECHVRLTEAPIYLFRI